MKYDLIDTLWKKRKDQVLIAAHRGTEGGNIIQNTLRAHKNALIQGADLLETDVALSNDGVFYVFHTGQEQRVFGQNFSIEKTSSKEIDNMKIRNGTFDLVNQRITKFEELVESLADETCIVVDRSWFYWEEFLKYIVKNGYSQKIIVKSPPTKERLDSLAKIAPNLYFMPIIKTEEDLIISKEYQTKINLVGYEIIFKKVNSPLISNDFISNCHKEKLLLWVNALNVNDETTLAAGFDDDTSILDSKEKGWGELIKRDFDIIQTDWPLLLRNYLIKGDF